MSQWLSVGRHESRPRARCIAAFNFGPIDPLVRRALLSLALVLLLASSGTSVPMSVLGDARFDSLQAADAQKSTLRRAPAEGSVLAASSGEYYLCLEGAVIPDQQFAGTDCWGWADTTDGIEYAIMGVASGIAFVNTNTMQVVDIVEGPTALCGSTRWRDIKTYKNYCYAVSECSGTRVGMMVMDMSYLPDSVKYIKSYTSAAVTTSHNMSIDTVKGFAYLVRSDYTGFHVVSLANPSNPTAVTSVTTNDIHDVFAHNDTAYVAEATRHTFSIWNMANKTSPVLLTRVTIPTGGYVHNIWPTADRNYVGTTEETDFRTVKFWDISDLANVQFVGEYLAPSKLAHNVHMERGKAFISHYESGVAVVDMTDPSTPAELARYDTYTDSEAPEFRGCWGIFPHTRSGKVYASNIDGRLFVFSARTELPPDTLKVTNAIGVPGEQVYVDIWVKNTEPLKELLLPINWSGPYNLIFDSISTAGSRTSYFEYIEYDGYDVANSRIAVRLVSSYGTTSPPLAPGNGSVLRIWFTMPSDASGDVNLVRLDPYVSFNTLYPTLTSGCLSYQPPTQSGSISIPLQSCCAGLTGNVNGGPNNVVDLSDLSMLIAYLTVVPSPLLPCYGEANIDGQGIVNLSDLSLLIGYLTTPAGSVTLPSCQ